MVMRTRHITNLVTISHQNNFSTLSWDTSYSKNEREPCLWYPCYRWFSYFLEGHPLHYYPASTSPFFAPTNASHFVPLHMSDTRTHTQTHIGKDGRASDPNVYIYRQEGKNPLSWTAFLCPFAVLDLETTVTVWRNIKKVSHVGLYSCSSDVLRHFEGLDVDGKSGG